MKDAVGQQPKANMAKKIAPIADDNVVRQTQDVSAPDNEGETGLDDHDHPDASQTVHPSTHPLVRARLL